MLATYFLEVEKLTVIANFEIHLNLQACVWYREDSLSMKILKARKNK